MQIGFKLAAEAFGPRELVAQAVRAEAAGFDFVEISDHFHPWLDVQGHSPFAWSVLGAIAAQTENLKMATGVTCPSIRYHPAIVAQSAATMAKLSDGRFTLGLGAGENLNEHVVGLGFPGVRIRHEMLREALEIIQLLWTGGYHSYDGHYLQLDAARVFDLPEQPPAIAVAAGGRGSARLAGELADGLFATEPRAELVKEFQAAGGEGPLYAEVPLAWAPTDEQAIDAVMETSRWAVTGWKVMSELPNPANFDAASRTVRAEDVTKSFAVGPDPAKHLSTIQQYAKAGFDHLVLTNSGPDPDGFFDFYERELRSETRSLATV
jgi:G6PDH family F420-dependent oxidoreductase